MPATFVYTVEVDVAIARPPTPANTRTLTVVVAVDPALSDFAADTEAKLVACEMAAVSCPFAIMPVACRIVSVIL